MRIGIMQPYFFPYLGYFQLWNAVDEFVIYDNIQYSKRGWINRNRILVDGKESFITLPLKKDSDFLDVRDRTLGDRATEENKKLLRRIEANYRNAAHFDDFYPVLVECMEYTGRNLFSFLKHSLEKTAAYLGIETQPTISSEIAIDHDKKGADKVLAICQSRGASEYINPPGGRDLYRPEQFVSSGVRLFFLEPELRPYPQSSEHFISHLSVIDLLMNVPRSEISGHLQACGLSAG